MAVASGWVSALTILAAWRAARARSAERVARAAHELRGPLTAATLGLELAARRGPSATLRAVELQLRRAALALEDLVGEGGTHERPMSVWSAPVELRRLVADCAECYAGCGRDVTVVGLPRAVWVRADAVRLAQAVGNLIANAPEHGEGAVEVALRAEHGRVRIEVTDGGPGLAAPVQQLVRRARGGRGRRGRGLAIAASIASAQGGRLFAAPAAGGARLVLELPTSSVTRRQTSS